MKWLGIIGWVVMGISVVLGVGSYITQSDEIERLTSLNERLHQEIQSISCPPVQPLSKEQAEELEARLKDLRWEVAGAEQELAALEEDYDALMSKHVDTAVETTPAVPENFDPTDLLKSMLDQGDIGEEDSPFGAAMKMFQGEQGEKYADIGAKYAVNMQYADLFKELGLDPEREAALREAIGDHMAEMMQQGFKMMEGADADLEAMTEATLAAQAELDRQVAELLSPEELEQYTAYQEELPRKMMRQSYEMQLGMLAPGLDADARSLVTEAMVDEMVMFNDPGRMPTDMGSVAEEQRAAFDRALERLAADLDDAQMEQVENFIEQQLSFMDIGMEMFGGDDAETE